MSRRRGNRGDESNEKMYIPLERSDDTSNGMANPPCLCTIIHGKTFTSEGLASHLTGNSLSGLDAAFFSNPWQLSLMRKHHFDYLASIRPYRRERMWFPEPFSPTRTVLTNPEGTM